MTNEAAAQACANNNALAGSAVTPTCPGSTTVPCVQGGQYALVNVVSGNIYTFSTCTATFDTQITLYNNGGGGSLGYNDDFCGLQSQVTWTATYTGQLRVLVDQYNCVPVAAGATNGICAPLVIQCSSPPPPLTNDNPCTAINLTVNTNCVPGTYTNVGATATGGVPAPSCSFYTGGDIWFTFTAPATGIATIETFSGTMTDASMALYTAPSCSGTFTEVACDDDSGPGLMPYLTFTNLTPGQVYYVRVWGYFGATGTFSICVHGITTMPAGDCVYLLDMSDSFGDGWDGSTVGISVNGGAFTYYTVTGSSNIALIGLNIGDILVVQYTANSPYEGEISYVLQFLSSGTAVFNSGSPPTSGIVFTQTVDCQPPPAPPEDCIGSITVCDGQSFNNTTNNTGNNVDLTSSNYGCLASGERQGTWYTFSPSNGGNVAFTISPTAPNTDYDFAIWGPFPPGSTPASICPPPSAPIRCSYSALYDDTGLNYTATDNTEGAGGDKWVNDLTVTAGQVYLLYISNWSQTGLAFDLNWDLQNGASLDCTVLPVELLTLQADVVDDHVHLRWATATEVNSDRFEIERSTNGNEFDMIGQVPAAGSSLTTVEYDFHDLRPGGGTNYYRLKQVDRDGHYERSAVVSVDYFGDPAVGRPYPNPAQDHVLLPVDLIRDGEVTYVVHDALGRIVRQGRSDKAAGRSVLFIDLGGLTEGGYSVVVGSNTGGAPITYPVFKR
ncbi:MAG: T9SS type A sorting domain-containing protein [Flavobacteriales bacterium]|nr:T9SS type A sorting domain-containing protein [Flavobacteriales bacterium]MCB9166199.1 T9SS type A sorting domain-containing protein [Flavobacteriales bacterium]